MITVKVIRNRDGREMTNTKVYIVTDGIAGGVRDGRTNQDGEVSIDFDLPCSGKVVVEGNEAYKGSLKAFMSVYVQQKPYGCF